MTQHQKFGKRKIITDTHIPHPEKKKSKLLQLAREKDQETLTNTIKQGTQQRGKEGTKERHTHPSRSQKRGSRKENYHVASYRVRHRATD
jgi:hypothetical protein